MALYNYRLMHAGGILERALAYAEYFKFRSFEAELAHSVSATIFCSRVDLECIRQVAPDANLVQVANGVDCMLFKAKLPGEERSETVFFSGNFKYSPNCRALTYFLGEVFPLVRRVVPGATLTVVGNGAAEFIRRKHPGTSGVVVHDFVPELRSYLAATSVAVAPMTVGSGVSNKVLGSLCRGNANRGESDGLR